MPQDPPDGQHIPDPASLTAEEQRLQEARAGVPWRAWGPYLSERQWGTVREDYSDNGDAWSYFSHDQARSRAYRWGEDGIAGISDDKQRLCLALALWNERDPILKERLFGLTNAEGNHGEDVKEYYFYVDNLPTHSYQRYLYKYPQAEFPYNDLGAGEPGPVAARTWSTSSSIRASSTRGVISMSRWSTRRTGRKTSCAASPCTTGRTRTPRCTCCPRCGSATRGPGRAGGPKPRVTRAAAAVSGRPGRARRTRRVLPARRAAEQTCCSARTRRTRRACSAPSRPTRFPKDGIGDHLLHGADTVNPGDEGTKVAARGPAVRARPAGRPSVLVRLTREGPEKLTAPFDGAAELIARRRAEADEFYEAITPPVGAR